MSKLIEDEWDDSVDSMVDEATKLDSPKEAPKKDIFCSDDILYYEIKRGLETPLKDFPNCYLLEPDMGGAFSFHNLYIQKKLTPSLRSKGLKDIDFTYWEKVVASDENVTVIDFQKKLNFLINCHKFPEDALKFWCPMFHQLIEKKSALCGFAKSRFEAKQRNALDNKLVFSDISLTGENTGNGYTLKFVPQREWFEARIKKLTDADLITILPKAERELFMIILGRVMIGQKRTVTTEGSIIDHTFRSLGIIVGKSAGLGKSTLLGYILEALSFCGYNFTSFSLDSKFGWGEVSTSDLAYNDDLTPVTQKRLLESSRIKTIVSNERLKTEKKGIDGIDTAAKTVILCNSNSYSITDIYNLDSGTKSRAKLLLTRHAQGLEEAREEFSSTVAKKSPSLKLKEHWDYLSKKLDTTPLVLAMWLCKLAADKFLETISYRLEKGRTGEFIYVKDDSVEYNSLEIEVKRLSAQLQIQIEEDPNENFINLLRFIQSNRPNGKSVSVLSKEFLAPTMVTAFGYCYSVIELHQHEEMLEILSQDYKEKNYPKYHLYSLLSSFKYDPDAFFMLGEKHTQLTQLRNLVKSVQRKTIEESMHLLTTPANTSMIGSPHVLSSYWEESANNISMFKEEYKRLKDNYPGFNKIFFTLLEEF